MLICTSGQLLKSRKEGWKTGRKAGKKRKREDGGREREIERQREEVGGREGDGDVKRREYKE